MSRVINHGLRARFGISVFTAFVVWLGLAGAASAQTFTLSGTVTGGGSPINGATVEALTNGTTTVAGSSTTNASGQYSIALAPAIYDLRVTPPAGSAFNQEVLQDVDVTASSQQVDVILLSGGGEPQTYPVSGTVRGVNGAPLTNVRVRVRDQSTFTILATVFTDTNGAYSATVAATSVRLEFQPTATSGAAPQSWFYSRQSLPLGTGLVFDLDLAVVTVSGITTDPGGNPVANATVSVSLSGSSGATTSWSSSGSTATSATGAYSLLMLSGTGTFTATPPSGSTFGSVQEPNVPVTGDTTKNLVFPATATMTGVVRGYGLQPVVNARVRAFETPTGRQLANVLTTTDGSYLMNLPIGNITLSFSASGSNPGIAPASWNWNPGVVIPVTGATTFNLDLPVVSVAGTVSTTANVPVANATVSANTSGTDAPASWSSNMSVATSATGTYSLLALRGTATFTATPPTGSTTTPLQVTGVALTADGVRDFVLPDGVTLSGTVRGIGGQPIFDAIVSASNGTFGFGNVRTDVNGNYSFTVAPGTLTVTFRRGSVSPLAPTNWTVNRYNVPVSGATTMDATLNVIRLSGKAQDSNGAPVPSVGVSASNSLFDGATGTQLTSSNSGSTNADGSYAMLLLTGAGSVSISPPFGSGFSAVTLNPVTFANNFTQRIVLQRPDSTPPVIVSGPAVLHLSDTSVSIGWTTNEPSTSYVDYGVGGLTQQAGSNALVTQHTVTLQNLTPNEIYTFRVFSRDRNNNGPAQSANDFFTMLAPPGDVTAPVILAGPTAVFVSDRSAIIQWLTNEPTTGMVMWSTSPTFESGGATAITLGEFVNLHATLVSGLEPSTDYFVLVRSQDPDANSIESSVFTFRTAAAPDIQAPVITAAPTVVARTHNSATIRWITDEAATSGVSYNDGTVFNVTSDDSLTTTHEIVLAGLTPGRTYSFTAASRDAGGNGPTLAGPFSFTTLGAPDVTPPVFASALALAAPTKTTVSFSWNSDEPATKVIRYGTVSGALDQVTSDLTLQTLHQVTLTGLLPGTRYFFTRQMTDASGNSATSAEDSVETIAEEVNTPPTPAGPLTASPNPTNTGSFTLTWGASTDDGPGGVKEYQILRDDVVIQTLPSSTTSYLIVESSQGQLTYRVRALDFSDAASVSQPITVTFDSGAPLLTLPQPITTPATTDTDAIVTYTATVADKSDPSPVVTCSPASGSAFPIGQTTVNCTGRDAAGNVSTGSFTVTVTDPFAPVLTVPAPITLQAENQNGATVTFTVTATDNHDPDPDVVCSPQSGSVFPVGLTVVTCTATDASGNTATRSFNVSIGAPPKVASSVVLQSSSATTTYGQPVTFTATVTGTNGSTPTGTVTFFVDGTTTIGQATLGSESPITASLTIASLAAGARSITATYAGDFGHETSTAAGIALDVARAQPVISVTGGTFVYDAAPHAATGSVTGVGGASIGTLTFTYDGSPSLPVTAGSYAVVGSFAGSDDYEAGSATGTLTINPGPSQTAVQPGPAIVFGQSATVTASVTSPTGQVPQGTVEFFDGVAPLGTSALNAAGIAQIVVPAPGAGTHTISAVYSGGGNFAGSVSAGAALDVARASTVTALTIVPNPAGLLESFKLTATVAVVPPGVGTAAGVVEFFWGVNLLGTAPLNLVAGVPTAALPMNGFPAGTYQITARYAGNASFADSTSAAVSQTVRGAESSTWTALSVSPTPSSRAGTNITIRAFVVPIAGTTLPAGTVQFYVWGSPLGSPVALANVGGTMTATLTTAALPAGLMQFTARYLGNAGFAASTSVPVSHTVYASTAPFATTTTLAVSSNPLTFGQPLTVTATVASGTRPTPGYLLLQVDGAAAQVAAVVSGVPTTFVVPNLSKGLHTITVQFVASTTTLAGSVANTFVYVQ